MSDLKNTDEDPTVTMKTQTVAGEKGKSKLLSPDPVRRKFITEMLHAFAGRKISFAELVNLPPKKIKSIAELGFTKLRHGRYNEARKIFEILTLIDHKNYFHHLALAGAYQKLKKHVDAIYQYSEVLKIHPTNLNALVNRGEIYLRHKNYRKAAEDFREAILLDSTGKNRFANRARSLVLAIKRSLEKDKQKKAAEISAPTRKQISPLQVLKARK